MVPTRVPNAWRMHSKTGSTRARGAEPGWLLHGSCCPTVNVDEPIQFDARGLGWADHVCEDEDSTLQVRLREMPIESDTWRSRHPELLDLLADDPCTPTSNVLARNVFVADAGPDLHDTVAERGTVARNWYAESTEEVGLRNPSEPLEGLVADPGLHEELPEFEPIPLDYVGTDSSSLR